jgi:hypothetical protein
MREAPSSTADTEYRVIIMITAVGQSRQAVKAVAKIRFDLADNFSASPLF